MKKIIATILSLFFLGIIKAQPLVSETQSTIQYPDKELELPEHIKFADLNKDNFLSLSEAKAIFDQYRDNQQKHLKNDLVDEVESAVIELISYLEGIDCRDIKKSVASKRFIEVYYNNKFLNLHEPNPNMGFGVSVIDTSYKPESLIPIEKEQTDFFDRYFSIGTSLTGLTQIPFNFPKNSSDVNGKSASPGKPETIVLFDLLMEIKPWKNAIISLTPEYCDGNGVGDGVGMGGYPNALYAFPQAKPYVFRAQFLQAFESKKESSFIKGGQFAIGKIMLQDMFDYNAYSGDPTKDFLNFNHMMAAAWDAATTAYGYTYGAGFKMDFRNSQFNFAVVTVNKEAGGPKVDWNIKDGHSFNAQYVQRFNIGSRKGSVRALAFYNRAYSGIYSNYITDSTCNCACFNDSVKAYNGKYGFALDMDFALSNNLGIFARYSWNDGRSESMGYTEADNAMNIGLAYSFGKFNRPNDKIGFACSVNGLSRTHQEYLANGGSGFMLGDGSLNYRKESAFEFFYSVNLIKYTTISLNYQYIINAGYNFDKGNAHFVGCRMNFTF